jgi:hypothetical protein
MEALFPARGAIHNCPFCGGALKILTFLTISAAENVGVG